MNLGIVGCGGMGRRHLRGMVALRRAVDMMQLTAVADRERARAESLAEEAGRLLGHRPVVYPDLPTMAASGSIEAVDITTSTDSHTTLCCQALEAGLHAIVEKPLAVTVGECIRISKAARDAARCLAVAENVRREPSYRLARAVIEGGLLGEIRLVIDHSLSGKDAILLTPWRHQRFTGGILLDDGVHSADVIEYFAGPVERVAAWVRLREPRRYARGDAGPVASAVFYDRWASELPTMTSADAEDEAVGVLQFCNGAVGSWTISRAAHGDSKEERRIYGTKGSLTVPPDRSGRSPILSLDNGDILEGDTLVKATPTYHLQGVTATLFRGDRPTPQEASFVELDQKLIAIELADFIEAAQGHHSPEVNAAAGTRNVALVWALCEASHAGAWVDVAQIESGALCAYQATLRTHQSRPQLRGE